MFSPERFPADRVFEGDDEVFVALDGVLMDFDRQRRRLGTESSFEAIKSLHHQHPNGFYRHLRGEFAGIIHDRLADQLTVFTNHTSSKPVFTLNTGNTFLAASELKVVVEMARALGHNLQLDVEGAYCLLAFGYMLGDRTLIEGIRKLRAGHAIRILDGKISYHEYDNLCSDSVHHDEREAVSNLDGLFRQAVELEYKKDLEYGYAHLTTLSGGLDSRMNLFVARDLGFEDITAVTFSENDAMDERIARKIAYDLGQGFLFNSLSHGNYLRNIADPVLANDGLVYYSGSAHLLNTLRKLSFDEFGLLHTGQLGDAILGGTYLVDYHSHSQLAVRALGDVVKTERARYPSEELFNLYNRGFNGIFNGNWVVSQFTEATSPFLHRELLGYCLAIPSSLRQKNRIYRRWIVTRYPRAARYIWEKTASGLSTTSRLMAFANCSWCRNHLIRKLGRLVPIRRASMNPFNYWARNNTRLVATWDEAFAEGIGALTSHRELTRDCQTVFRSKDIIARTRVLTLLKAHELLLRP